MRILVINPNTTEAMTHEIDKVAQAAASKGSEIETVQPKAGPRSIEGNADEVLAAYHTLEVVAGLAALAAGQVNAQPRGLQAARLFGAAEALRETLGTPLLPIYQDHYQRRLASARTLIDEATFAAAWAEGRAIALEQAIAEALEVLQDAPLTKARPRL